MYTMNCQLYEQMALDFYKPKHRYYEDLFQGLREEVQEVIEAESLDNIVEELGDVLWYITVIASGTGVNLSEVMMRNINKLERRTLSGKNT